MQVYTGVGTIEVVLSVFHMIRMYRLLIFLYLNESIPDYVAATALLPDVVLTCPNSS